MRDEFREMIVEPLAAELRAFNAHLAVSEVGAPAVRKCPRGPLPVSVADYVWPDPQPAWCERWPN